MKLSITLVLSLTLAACGGTAFEPCPSATDDSGSEAGPMADGAVTEGPNEGGNDAPSSPLDASEAGEEAGPTEAEAGPSCIVLGAVCIIPHKPSLHCCDPAAYCNGDKGLCMYPVGPDQ